MRTSSSTGWLGRLTAVVVVVARGAVVLAPEPPHADAMTTNAIVTTAFVMVVVLMSATCGVDRRPGADGADEIEDRPARLASRDLLPDDHVVRRVREDPVDAVRRQLHEDVLCREPAGLGAALCRDDDEGNVAEARE